MRRRSAVNPLAGQRRDANISAQIDDIIVEVGDTLLLEGAPEGMSAAAIITDLETSVDGAASVHHVHAWQLTERRPMITLEVTAEPGVCSERLRRAVKARLAAVFNVAHATVEVVSEPRENVPTG